MINVQTGNKLLFFRTSCVPVSKSHIIIYNIFDNVLFVDKCYDMEMKVRIRYTFIADFQT